MSSDYIKRAEKVLQRINELSTISETDSGITRTFGTPAFIKGSQLVESWMKEAGLETRIDNIGNVRGKLTGKSPHGKIFVIASHIDTVVLSGKFDGPLGVILGLDILEQLKSQNLPFDIELIAFSDEEGVRFHTTYLGSKVVAGSFDQSLLQKKDSLGSSLEEVITAMGKNPSQLKSDIIAPEKLLGYFEVHIEQGPVLYESNIPVAVVTAIAGQKRVEITFKGMAGHAGTVPMDMRQDALCAAAEFVIETERFGTIRKGEIVATIGKLTIPNSASNVIPGEVVCTLDLRSPDEGFLSIAYRSIQQICKTICDERSIDLTWNLIQETKPVACDGEFNILLSEAIESSGFEVVKLVSGAGHDAVSISEISPVSMLFVRCFKGISHNPLEDVELNDIASTIKVCDNFFINLIKKYNQQ